jgi:hypothetical protein
MAIDFFKIGQAAAPSSVDISKAVKEGFAEGLKPIEEYEKSRKQRVEALGRILQQTPNLDELPKITAQYKQPIMDWAMGKKKEFSDAAAVLVQASPESQEYRDAIQKINSVNSAFQNLDNNLKNIQAERKEYLEDLRSGNISNAFQNSDIEQAYGANGGITSINDDGNVFMTGNEGKSFNWSERQEHYLVQGDTQKAMVDLTNKAIARGLQGAQFDKNQYKEELKTILTNPKIGSLQSLRSLVYDNIDGTDLNLKTISEIKNLVDDPNAFQNLPQIREQIAETLSTALVDINESNYETYLKGKTVGEGGSGSAKPNAQEYYNLFIQDPIKLFESYTGYKADFDKNTGIVKATDVDGKQFIANLKDFAGRNQFFRLLLDKSGFNKGTRNDILFDFDNIVTQNSQEELSKLFEGASTQEQPTSEGPTLLGPTEYPEEIVKLENTLPDNQDEFIKSQIEKYKKYINLRSRKIGSRINDIKRKLRNLPKNQIINQKTIARIVYDTYFREGENKERTSKFKKSEELKPLLKNINQASTQVLGAAALKEDNVDAVLNTVNKQDAYQLTKQDFLIYEYVQAGGNIEDIVNNNDDIDITFKE